jgi:hypothetical protein
LLSRRLAFLPLLHLKRSNSPAKVYYQKPAIPYLEILLENLEFSKVSAVKKSRISQENDLIATENPGFKSF